MREGDGLGDGALGLSETMTRMAGMGLRCIAAIELWMGQARTQKGHSYRDFKVWKRNLIVRPGHLCFYWFVI